MGTYRTIAHFGYHVNYFYIVVIFGREAQAKCVPWPLKVNHEIVLRRKSDRKGRYRTSEAATEQVEQEMGSSQAVWRAASPICAARVRQHKSLDRRQAKGF